MAEAVVVVGAVFEVYVLDQLLLERDGQLEGGTVSRGPVVLDQRADRPAQVVDQRLRRMVPELDAVIPQPGDVPARVRAPQVEDGRDAGLGQLPRPRRAAVLYERVEGVEALPYIVHQQLRRRAGGIDAVERQRQRAAVGEEAGAGMFVDGVLVEAYPGGVLGVEQRVQVAARHMVLGREPKVSVRTGASAEVGDVAVLGVEDARHRVAAKLDSAADVPGIDVAQLHHEQPPWRRIRRAAIISDLTPGHRLTTPSASPW